MIMSRSRKGAFTVIFCSMTVILPGALMLGYPGVMAPYWQDRFQVGEGPIGNILFFMWLPVGIFMFLAGKLHGRYGTRLINISGSLVCGLSILLMSSASSIRWVYLWASLHGIGTCTTYNPALTAAQGWFPRRKGLVSGIVNLAFGIAGAAMVPIFAYMASSMSPAGMHVTLSVAILLVGMTAGQFVAPPGEERRPDEASQRPAGDNPLTDRSFTVAMALRTRAFWYLWSAWALQGAAGMSMLTLSTAFGLFRGFPVESAALVLMAFNLTNGGSRILTGYLSDVVGGTRVMAVAFFAAGTAYMLLPYVSGVILTLIMAATAGFAFGTLITVTAPLVVECFGLKHFGAIFGLLWSAIGFVSGLIGPSLCGYVLDITGGNYVIVFSYLGLCSLVSAILIRRVRPSGRSLDNAKTPAAASGKMDAPHAGIPGGDYGESEAFFRHHFRRPSLLQEGLYH
jgi:OFA family oxalate/formate antiporter-like MFS transporter